LLHPLGRGGMGEVLAGRDPTLNRSLAVKVLRADHRGNAELERRFLEEAQICGQLQHPGVVPVHDCGTLPDGRPFFTMKLVKGRTLAELLRERQSPADDLPRFVAVFEQVCQTLAYAHSRGVIHRDLKPANVMVGEFGEVQVMDWGLAKVLPRGAPIPPAPSPDDGAVCTVRTGGDDYSRAGTVAGTPAYMAPEQARGETDALDARADVFGLGAVLCEILTGDPPYRGRGGVDVLQAASADSEDAFARLDGCGADAELVRLAKQCLAMSREDRPRDAGAVAQEVTAYRRSVDERLKAAELAGVRAEERAQRTRQRLRWVLALSAAGVVIVALLAAGGWWVQRQWAEDDRRRAAAERQQAETAAAAEADLGTATAAAERGDDGTAREALERAEVRLAGGGPPELRERFGLLRDDLDFAAELEEARMTALETTNESAGLNWAGADAAYARAFAARGLDVTGSGAAAAVERIGQSAVKARLVTALDVWANARRQAGAEGWEGLLEAAGRADDSGDQVRQQFREAALRSDTGRLKELAGGSGVAAWPAADAVLLADALLNAKEREAAVQVLRAAQGRNPGDFWLNITLGEDLGASSEVLGFASPVSRDEGAGFLRAAVALRPRAAAAHNDLGVVLSGQGKAAEAEKEFREALRIQPDLGVAHSNLGALLYSQGKLAEAEREYREALRTNPGYPKAHNNLGLLLADQGKAGEAEREYKEALRLEPGFPTAHYNLGNLLKGQGQAAEAEQEYREALRLNPGDFDAHNNLGNLLRRQGKLAEAEKEYREAIRLKPEDPEAHCKLGDALRDQGRFREALDEFHRGHELGARDPRWRYPFAAWVEGCRRLVEFDALLPAVLAGAAEPADADADLGFAFVCRYTNRYAAAARLSAAAFDAAPEAANDLRIGARHNAACSAALAGCGQGIDAPADEAERDRLRARALAWLRADLDARIKQAGSWFSGVRAEAAQALRHWREDPDLAGVRDADALEKLPEDERAEWRRLWADVDAVLQKAASPK
jgi:serine/threonine-protein kinase